MYLRYSLPPYLSHYAKCLESVVHHQRVHLCWCSVLTALYYGFISCVCTGSLAMILSLWLWGRNRMDSYQVNTVDVPESPNASGVRSPWQQQQCHSLHCHEEWWGSVPPSVATCFTQSLKILLCTKISCHFNFYSGTLLYSYKHSHTALALSLWKSTFFTLQ